MTTFVDYAWWTPSPAQLTAMGFSGVMRYISHDGSKDITDQEVANLRAAGFDIGIVYESTATRSTEGFGAGYDDAVFANAMLDLLGYPPTCLATYAVDFDAQPSQVQPYFDGVAAAQLRPSAPYGSFAVVDGVRYPAPFAWQTAAWSGGRISPRAGLLQNGFHPTYDSNRVLVADFGQWRAHADPPPQPKGKKMYRFTHKGFTYLTDGVWYRWVGSPEESSFYDGKVTDWGEVPDVVFNALVPWNATPSPAAPGPSFP